MVFIFNNNEFNSIKSMEGHVMVYIIRWVLLGLCSAAGMALIPIYPATGAIVALGCFLILAFDIARQFIS